MNVLELFAGSRSIGKVCDNLGYNVFSSDINSFDNIDYVIDINKFDVSLVPFIPDFIWASPPCTYFSVASIGKHWNKNNTPKSDNALKGVEYVKSTLKIINYFKLLNPNLNWFMENPRGKLRKLNIVKGLPRTTVWYCKYGDTRAKPTDIWSNNIWNPMFNTNGWKPREECFNGNKDCHHEAAPRGSRTGTQGLKGNYDRSKIPQQLCEDIVKSNI
jgi:site-specific DNA-cytosine methylase|tara:strand:+ start:1103 stop:1750 length:648 start_codon:yes stop_codon:yes gene_type:complete